MYNVAFVEDDKCVAQKGCRLCIMYCPEADCIKLDTRKMKAYVVVERCKGCDLCIDACKPGVLTMTETKRNAHGYLYPELSPGCTACHACALIGRASCRERVSSVV